MPPPTQWRFICTLLLVNVFFVCSVNIDIASQPYHFRNNQHGSTKTIEQIKSMLRTPNAKKDEYEIFDVNQSDKNVSHAQVQVHQIAADYASSLVNGRFIHLDNPMNHFSILEPKDGCGTHYTVQETVASRTKKCRVATNAGFFNTHNFQCYGNLVANGKVVQNQTHHNANFGITKKGKYYVGYVTMDTPRKHNDEFVDLVSGVIWLVRNGEPYVAQSSNVEDMSVQESGHEFVTLRASRVGLGHDAYGKLMIVQFDGDGNHHKGPNLYELADMMIELGAINAINLDGGGSTTVVQDDVLANSISDGCGTEPMFRCARKVTTVTCIHDLWEDTEPTNVPTVTPSTTVEANCTREYESLKSLVTMASLGLGALAVIIIVMLVVFTCAICNQRHLHPIEREEVQQLIGGDSDSDNDTEPIQNAPDLELEEIAVQPQL